jgi:nicotinic acid mononucleotide adenylyltransferase
MLETKENYQNKYCAKIYFSDDKEFVVSSTEVRFALSSKNFETCRNLLTEEVLRYIIKGGLYFEA